MAEQDDPRSEDAFLKAAYTLTDLAGAMAFYSQWAGQYDDKMESVLGYVAPRLMAEKFANALDDPAAAVLDVGCGTGLTSHYLSGQDFSQIDGIDLNEEMLEMAQKRGIYRNLIQADITQPIDLPDAAYQGIISSGTFTLGHVGAEPLPELTRLLKTGGILGCTIHRDIWSSGGFEAQFDRLTTDGALRQLSRVPGEFFAGYGETAFYCLFQKT